MMVFLIVFISQKIFLNSKIHQRTFGLISPRPNHPFTLSVRRPLIWTALAVFLAQAETRGKLMVGWKRGEFCSDLFPSAQVVKEDLYRITLDVFFFWKIPWRNIYSNRIACDHLKICNVMRYHDEKNNTKNLYPYDLWAFWCRYGGPAVLWA